MLEFLNYNMLETFVTLISSYVYTDGYNSQDILTTDHKLARSHYSLQGRAFDQLAKAFSHQDDGDLMMDVLNDVRVQELNKAVSLDPTATPTKEEVRWTANSARGEALVIF